MGSSGCCWSGWSCHSAGSIDLRACDLEVWMGALLTTNGRRGANTLEARRSLVLGADAILTAGSVNELRYRSPLSPPRIDPRTRFTPAPVVVQDPTLRPCAGAPACGDEQVDPEETCDDGNLTACDGCSPVCLVERCGDGAVACGEGCDDGTANGIPGAVCDAGCRLVPPACGDGRVDPGETCDDGNLTACDGCAADCRVERCGDGVVACGEECDDGAANGIPGAACDVGCRLVPLACSDPLSLACTRCLADDDCGLGGRCAGVACVAGTCAAVERLDCSNSDPLGVDLCVPGDGGMARCEHRCVVDVSCDDGDACDGDERCADGACVVGPLPTGSVGVRCAVDAVAQMLAAAPPDGISRRVRRILDRQMARLRGLLASPGTAPASRRRLAKMERKLGALMRITDAAVRHRKMAPSLAVAVAGQMHRARDALRAVH